jgi:hypothetical protein
MKSSISISALAIALVTIITGPSAVTALEAYKTKIDQVVVTGLQAKKMMFSTKMQWVRIVNAR